MCGRCCLGIGHHLVDTLNENHLPASQQTEIDWERIVEFIKERNGGILKLRQDEGSNEISVHQIKEVSDLPWEELDYSYCPFVKQKRDNEGRFTSGYYCEINDFKPATCRKFPFNYEHAKRSGCPGYDV